jgi:DNA polymerase elongation subunit (family B)
MKIVSIDIETVLDEEAAERCGYTPSEDFAPFPLHAIVCASAFSVTGTASGDRLYAVESFSLGKMSERGIVASVEEAVGDADIVYSFNGSRFDLPVMAMRAMVHEVHVPRILDLQNRSRIGRHFDLLEQVKRDAAPISLRQLCAPFGIPSKQAPSTRVAEHASAGNWAAIEHYCEADAVACWLSAQVWSSAQEPGFARAAWRDFAKWVTANADEHPTLAPFANVVGRPPTDFPARAVDELYF